jgi:integrase
LPSLENGHGTYSRMANEICGMRRVLHRHGIYSLFSASDVNTFLSAPHSAHCIAIQREGLAFRDVYQSVGSGSCGYRIGCSHFWSSAVGAKTTRNICITLQSMWTTAKAWGYVAHNLMEGVVLPDVKRVQRFFLSKREIQLILAKAKEPYRTWYGLAAETGLRAGELCGLTVDDIDLERGMLQVRQSAWRGKLGDPKTDESIRVVELSPQACGHLRTFLESWHPNERRLLFATRNGTPWDQNLLLTRKFRPLLRALGIHVPHGNGFHAFRHYLSFLTMSSPAAPAPFSP